jgi:hypothetical protein
MGIAGYSGFSSLQMPPLRRAYMFGMEHCGSFDKTGNYRKTRPAGNIQYCISSGRHTSIHWQQFLLKTRYSSTA